MQGLLAAWRRRSYQWEALVIVVVVSSTADSDKAAEEEAVIMQRWVPAADLRPVPADPNRAFGAR